MSPEEAQRALMAQGAKEAAVQRAQETIADIRALQGTPAFARYYVRSLRERRERLAAKACDYCEGPYEHERLVAQIRLLDELLKMPETDRVVALRVLDPAHRT